MSRPSHIVGDRPGAVEIAAAVRAAVSAEPGNGSPRVSPPPTYLARSAFIVGIAARRCHRAAPPHQPFRLRPRHPLAARSASRPIAFGSARR